MTTSTETDEQRWSRYMAAAHRGDRKIYEVLLRELGDVIERYLQRRFGHVGFREDCVQECLLAIHVGRHTNDPRRPFRAWFFAVVRNKTIDVMRRSLVSGPAPLPLGAAASGYEPDPADELVAAELLDRLEPLYRDALELTKLRGYTTAEAAAHAGISETAMRTRVSRALRATAQLLNEEYGA
jgi:RNA polymerase sigma-70 factor (ECF subfamily)